MKIILLLIVALLIISTEAILPFIAPIAVPGGISLFKKIKDKIKNRRRHLAFDDESCDY